MGEPGGIGPDIALAAWAGRLRTGCPSFAMICDPALLISRAREIGLNVTVVEADPDTAARAFQAGLPVIPLSPLGAVRVGATDAALAGAVVDSIRHGYELASSGQVLGLVTNPIHKKTLYDADFPFPGHTEFLAHLAQENSEGPVHPVMMLVCPDLRVVPMTIHVPLRQVADMVTPELIERTVSVIASDMRTRFAIERPRIAVSGLNPHAGEGGTLGEEERALIAPAVEKLKRLGHDVRGPFSADTLFHAEARATYDVALTMYHDQALIAAKTLNFHDSVNVTLGLPIIRTSPDHGTALSLAGTGRARPDSLISALKLAAAMARTR